MVIAVIVAKYGGYNYKINQVVLKLLSRNF